MREGSESAVEVELLELEIREALEIIELLEAELDAEVSGAEFELDVKLRSSGGGGCFVGRPDPDCPVVAERTLDGEMEWEEPLGSGELRLSVRSSCSTCWDASQP